MSQVSWEAYCKDARERLAARQTPDPRPAPIQPASPSPPVASTPQPSPSDALRAHQATVEASRREWENQQRQRDESNRQGQEKTKPLEALIEQLRRFLASRGNPKAATYTIVEADRKYEKRPLLRRTIFGREVYGEPRWIEAVTRQMRGWQIGRVPGNEYDDGQTDLVLCIDGSIWITYLGEVPFQSYNETGRYTSDNWATLEHHRVIPGIAELLKRLNLELEWETWTRQHGM